MRVPHAGRRVPARVRLTPRAGPGPGSGCCPGQTAPHRPAADRSPARVPGGRLSPDFQQRSRLAHLAYRQRTARTQCSGDHRRPARAARPDLARWSARYAAHRPRQHVQSRLRAVSATPLANVADRLQEATPQADDSPIALLHIAERVDVPATSPPEPNAVTEVATRVHWKLTDTLPTARTLLAAVNLLPGRHPRPARTRTPPSAARCRLRTCSCSTASRSRQLRGTPFNLFIEDAIQETTVATSGISAEYGRFTGGVVNAITSRAATASTDRSARRSPTTTGGRVAVRRAENRQHGADLRVDLRRPDPAESHLVLRRRPARRKR